VAALSAALGAATVATNATAASPVVEKNPNTIRCPAPPPGWSDPAITKNVITPESVPNALDADNGGELEAQGGNAVTVQCNYHHTRSEQVAVIVSYALPTDPNPFADFDFGCGKGSVTWLASYRAYRVASSSQWALATLDDSDGNLHSNQIPEFEKVAQELLHNAEGYAHSCSLVTKPTLVSASIHFDIYVAGTNLKDTFLASQTRTKGRAYPIKSISSLTATLQVPTGAGTRSLKIDLTRGIDYRPATAKAAGRVRFGFLVEGSRVPSCSRGAKGMLTISTKPAVSLHVCGRTFLPTPVPRVEFFN